MTSFNHIRVVEALRALPAGATVLVPAGQPGFERLVALCELQGLDVYSAAAAADGALSLSDVERCLGADAADRIAAILVPSADQALVPALEAVAARCWHDAQVILAPAVALAARQAA